MSSLINQYQDVQH